MRKILGIIVVVLLGMGAFLFYNWFTKDRVSGEMSIEQDGAKSLDVIIRFGAGKFLIEGGATEWVDGDIDISQKKWYPSVAYKNKKRVGHVEIVQKGKGFSSLRKERNDWHLQLTDQVPVDLDIEMGAGEAELNLVGIRLSQLSIDAGVSDATINLDGDWVESFDADINLGVSDAKIHLPKEVGVKLTVSKGLGTIDAKGFISKGEGVYVNEAYGNSDTTIDLKVDVGIGEVKLLLGK